MAKFESIQNVHLLLSHRATYGTTRSIDDILDGPIPVGLLTLLSVLAFDRDEEQRFRSWALAKQNVKLDQDKIDKSGDRVVFGRPEIFACWKQLLSRTGTPVIPPANKQTYE